MRRKDKYKKRVVMLGTRRLELQGYEPQALMYLINTGFAAADIRCECESVPIIRYKYGKRFRDYFPDMYVPTKRLIIEVKSEFTLGLLSNTKRGFSMTCAKAIAAHKAGFKFALLLMKSDGTRLKMPKNWAYMKKAQLVQEINKLNPLRSTGKLGLFQM